ncbi:MAG: hypothetical protein K8I30_20995, partial [Anaerolineae bacterium]|nr:hypothetical protein [Anaerolineae bacterium]
MLVALSLGLHLVTDQTRSQVEAFATPSVLYFVSALLMACAMLVPEYDPRVLGVLFLAGGAVGLLRSSSHFRELIRAAREHQDFTRWDWLSQIILPIASYALLILAGLGFLLAQYPLAFGGVCLSMILLLIAAIANTWSLVIWIIEKPRP